MADLFERMALRIDPFKLQREFWPRVELWDRQVEVVESVVRNVTTVVPSCNKAGKDFVAGFTGLYVWIAAAKLGHSCRIITTSVAEEHLKVLWGEVGRFLGTSRHPLMHPDGPFVVNFQELRRAAEMHVKNPLSYFAGRVAGGEKEGLAGHHAEITLAIIDEASGVPDASLDKLQGWAKRFLILGNPNPCTNFFRRMVERGSILAT